MSRVLCLCEVSEATRTSIVCIVMIVISSSELLSSCRVAINLTTVNDGYDATSDCPNFGLTVTEYGDAEIVANSANNRNYASSQNITSSDNEITIYGCNFNILNPTIRLLFLCTYFERMLKEQASHSLEHQPTLLLSNSNLLIITKLSNTNTNSFISNTVFTERTTGMSAAYQNDVTAPTRVQIITE